MYLDFRSRTLPKAASRGNHLDQEDPQQVGKHASDLVHVLNQAKVVFNPEMKLESIQFIFKIRRCLTDVFGLQVEDVAQGRLQGEQIGPGGPQQVGKHPTNLGHILNHAKVAS